MKHFRKEFDTPLLLVLLLLGFLSTLTLGHPDHVDHTDKEIDAMNIDTLVHVEHDLRSQNGIVDKHVASLHGRLAKLKSQQEMLQATETRVIRARDWETRQKTAGRKELERARAELEAKREQIQMLQSEAHKLREEIREMKDVLRDLNLDKTELDNQYLHPSLDAILIRKAARLGSVPQHILNKTITHIIPEVEHGLHEVFSVQENIPNDSTLTTVLTSFCLYVLALSVLYITWTFLRNFKSLFTLTRILFTVDMAFAFTWILSCLIHIVLSADPFAMMAERHGGLTVIVQIVLIAALLGNVILRCVPFSLHLRNVQFIELLCSIFVAQHYYQSVWRPCMLDEELFTTVGTYFMYFLISAGLAIYRARSFGRGMEEVQDFYRRGPLSLLQKGTWIRMKMERTLRYCEDLFSGSSKLDDETFPVEPQYYRKTRHPELPKGKGRTLRYGKSPIFHRRK